MLTMTDPIIEANSLSELQTALRGLGAHYWQARAAFYLPYDQKKQVLTYLGREWELDADTQPGACALSLRTVSDQSLSWPEGLEAGGHFRVCVPIFHWGSLNAVICLGFEQDPGDLKDLDRVGKVLGVIGDKVMHREKSAGFLGRCRELLVQAVEARGQKDHVARCGRLSSALAGMLDCSAQVKADLQEAAECHDFGLVTFERPDSAQAVREHPLIGAGLLRSHPDMAEVALLVESHHERYDGSGTPYGRSGDDLPLEAWILALVEEFVETWEASRDSYEDKVKHFFEGPARHHHPDVVDALCGLVDAERLEELMG